jgi:hypothetical protein
MQEGITLAPTVTELSVDCQRSPKVVNSFFEALQGTGDHAQMAPYPAFPVEVTDLL